MGLKMKSPHLEESFLKEKVSWIEEKAGIFDRGRRVVLCVWKSIDKGLARGDTELNVAACLGAWELLSIIGPV